MFSDKTIALAEEFMKVQRELKASIEEDLDAVSGTLCTLDRLQIWVDDGGITRFEPVTLEQVKEAIGVPIDEEDTAHTKYLKYKIGSVSAVTLYSGKDM